MRKHGVVTLKLTSLERKSVMTNAYKDMKERHQKEFNEFPMVFAFSDEQFKESMNQLGLDPTETDKIYAYGDTGGFFKKSDAEKLHDMNQRHSEERKNAIATDDNFIYEMFFYELGNHEYGYTQDVSDTLDALGLTIDEVNNNVRLLKALEKACKACEKNEQSKEIKTKRGQNQCLKN